MYAFTCVDVPFGRSLVDSAIDLFRRARRAGVTVRSSVDCLIAASALRHGLTVVHCDRDYDQLARVVPLDHVNISPRLRRKRT